MKLSESAQVLLDLYIILPQLRMENKLDHSVLSTQTCYTTRDYKGIHGTLPIGPLFKILTAGIPQIPPLNESSRDGWA